MNSSNSKSWEVYPRSRNLYTTDVIINSHFQLLPSQKGSPQWVTPQVWLAEFYALFMASLIQPQRGFVYLAGIKPAQLLPSGETIFQDHKLPFLIKRKKKKKKEKQTICGNFYTTLWYKSGYTDNNWSERGTPGFKGLDTSNGSNESKSNCSGFYSFQCIIEWKFADNNSPSQWKC